MPKKGKSRAGGAHSTFSQLLATARSEDDPDKLVCDISRLLGVPDVRTARGLKECHYSFNTVSSKLDELYTKTRDDQWDRGSADRLAAFIIFTYGRIGEDLVLRKRIFSETQFLEKAVALLSSPDVFVGEVVLKTLSDLVSHDCSPILARIISFLPTILDYAEANAAQIRVECKEAVVCLLVCTHLSVYSELNTEPSPDPELAALAPISRVLDLSLNVVQLADSTSRIRRFFTFFCFMTAKHHVKIFLAAQDLIDFLVAATRATDFHTRCFAQSSLVRLYSETSWKQWKPGQGRHERLQELKPGSKPLSAQARPKMAEFFTLVQSFNKNSQQSCSQLGHALSDYMQEHTSVVRGFLTVPLSTIITNLPTVLESCEAALRRDGASTRSALAADILHFELLLSRDKTKACAFARSCIERHPSAAFFCHAMTAFPDSLVSPLSSAFYAEKGLQCRPISPFMQRELLAWVAIFAHSTATTMLDTNGPPTIDHLRKVLILIAKGLSHAKVFLDMTQVDHPRAAEMSSIFALCSLMAKGDSLTLTELESMRTRFSLECEIARCNDLFRLTKECSALELIFNRMPTAWGHWGPIMSRTDPMEPPWQIGQSRQGYLFEVAQLNTADELNGDQFLSWLQKLATATPDVRESEILGDYDTGRTGEAGLHSCSACHSPNAALKRCSGCYRARYCNDTCQRNHWKVHRDVCKAK